MFLRRPVAYPASGLPRPFWVQVVDYQPHSRCPSGVWFVCPQPTFSHLFVRKLRIINDASPILRRLVRLSSVKCGAERARVGQCGPNRKATHPR
jgi:hypothetical protein